MKAIEFRKFYANVSSIDVSIYTANRLEFTQLINYICGKL